MPDSTQASIVARGRTFSSDGTPTFLSIRGHSDVVISWSGEQAVRIGFPGPEQVYKRDQSVGDVTIAYD
ncbi:hypothetical protein AYJ54_41865 [Bradyrhizobium centrolobii]|uniref:Uncharacterized protein n=1 Tax=Bradyrhizobium centrolobii TaxID=1505087 RepID=A0A176Z4C4_9BRAD|nr:hypothetical protein AYJ54_41865 [Bradyrhizobium centrolobii]